MKARIPEVGAVTKQSISSKLVGTNVPETVRLLGKHCLKAQPFWFLFFVFIFIFIETESHSGVQWRFWLTASDSLVSAS